ncbi:unnamed protein product [Brachionus calyciflorus]|uniref:Uncharacterized protein n=1 Tax=Brachionus calyciflorus TaxID=104777 RepID=A0A814GHX8_9BILA|nr:unnamed protein product [Brachionus calyciflorus]
MVTINKDENNNFCNQPNKLFEINNNKWDIAIYEGSKFHVIFDILTPRPHFIVKYIPSKRKYPRFKKVVIADLDDQDLRELFDFLENFIKAYNLNSNQTCISFHTGKWASTPEFHGHICVDLNVYLNIFETFNVDMEEFQPNSNWNLKTLTNEINNKKSLYIENVKFYQTACLNYSAKYKLKEIEKIHKEKMELIQMPMQIGDIRLDFDLTVPKLKFNYVNKNGRNLPKSQIFYNLVKEMNYFGFRFDLLKSPNGCHICLKLDQNNNSYGYIHLSADSFYKIHPLPQIFLNNFQLLSNYYIET